MAATGSSAAAQTKLTTGGAWPSPVTVPTIDAPNVNGAVVLSGKVSGAKIGPVIVTRAFRAVEQRDGAVTGLVIDGLTATDLQRDGIRIRQADGLTIANFTLRFRAAPQSGRNLPEGIAIYAGKGIVIRNGVIDGFRMVTKAGAYTNGDGIATEPGVTDALIEDVTSSNNSDGGFDLKGTVRLDRLTAIGNKRNYRFWGNITAGTLTSQDPTGASIAITRGTVVVIDKLIVRQKTLAPILILDGGTLTIKACDIQAPAGTKLSKVESAGSVVTLGPGCTLP